jgi:GNAT superfamily N-acetyltransferase
VNKGVDIVRAGPEAIDALVPLFGAYREFYRRPPEPEAERAYLMSRLSRGEAVVFLALAQGEGAPRPAGFTLLYPAFASVSLAPAWVLNDLYVAPGFRRRGVARALLQHAADFARATTAVRLELRTQHTNREARALYESLGWKLDEQFSRYTLPL